MMIRFRLLPAPTMLRMPMMELADGRMVDDAAVGNDGVIDLRPIDLRSRQKTRAGENRRAHVEEIEARQLGSEIEVRFEEGADGSDVLPVALENIGEHAMGFDGAGMMCLPKSVKVLSSSLISTSRLKT